MIPKLKIAVCNDVTTLSGDDTFLNLEQFEDIIRIVEESRWIPVSERLPKDADKVDVIAEIERASGKKSIERICDIYWGHTKVAYPDSYAFTHWRPIPTLQEKG